MSNGRLNQKLIESTNNDDGNFLHAVTKYKVLKTVEGIFFMGEVIVPIIVQVGFLVCFFLGFSFLELSPMTGRKHQVFLTNRSFIQFKV